jgi:flagellar P-ring protein precursor FlgI
MGVTMKRLFLFAVVLLLMPQNVLATRIKDIASFDGVRENQLIGYGLVVGLNGSGDSDQTKFPVQTLTNLLERSGVSIRRTDITVKNIAAVMVTATLPPLSKQGTRLDVLVSSMGDAKSLAGGTLLMTPLKGGDGQIYAVAQGAISTSSFSYGGQSGGSSQKNHPTAGRVPEGALVERELPYVLSNRSQLRLNLHRPDFTTASRIASVINGRFQGAIATCKDPGSVFLTVPDKYQGNTVEFAAALESLQVQPDMPAKVVLNERTGTIVIGNDVRLSTVAVAHGNLTLTIKETPKVSQPEPFSRGGDTVVVPRTSIKVNEEKGEGLYIIKEGANIGDVVKALNAIGVTPRDLIGIMQAIKAAGALQGELEII